MLPGPLDPSHLGSKRTGRAVQKKKILFIHTATAGASARFSTAFLGSDPMLRDWQGSRHLACEAGKEPWAHQGDWTFKTTNTSGVLIPDSSASMAHVTSFSSGLCHSWYRVKEPC